MPGKTRLWFPLKSFIKQRRSYISRPRFLTLWERFRDDRSSGQKRRITCSKRAMQKSVKTNLGHQDESSKQYHMVDGFETLAGTCANVRGRIDDFLKHSPSEEVTKRFQARVRTSLAVAEEALTRYRYASMQYGCRWSA